MSNLLHSSQPVLKVGEYSTELGEGAYIYFDESIDLPFLGCVDIQIEFNKNNSYDEVSNLVSKLKESGLRFVVKK